jgi:hypothetical protein
MPPGFVLAGLLILMATAIVTPALRADDAPIAGTVKAVDPAANILTVQSAARGKTREVAVHVRADTKIVRFIRGADGRFAEQTATLTEIRPGWTVSVTTQHEGDKEVARLVRVVHEK